MKPKTERIMIEALVNNHVNLQACDLDQEGYMNLKIESETIHWIFNMEGKGKKIDRLVKRLELGIKPIEVEI